MRPPRISATLQAASRSESASPRDELLELLETLGEVERWVSIAWVAGRGVAIPEDDLNEALRRALVVRAVGGDPQRELDLDEEAVVRLAAELDSDERREQLELGIRSLTGETASRSALMDTIVVLLERPDVAWRAYACGLLAEELERET